MTSCTKLFNFCTWEWGEVFEPILFDMHNFRTLVRRYYLARGGFGTQRNKETTLLLSEEKKRKKKIAASVLYFQIFFQMYQMYENT